MPTQSPPQPRRNVTARPPTQDQGSPQPGPSRSVPEQPRGANDEMEKELEVCKQTVQELQVKFEEKCEENDILKEVNTRCNEELTTSKNKVDELTLENKNLKARLAEEAVLKRKLLMKIQELKGNIQVFCRARPAEEETSAFLFNDPESKVVEVVQMSNPYCSLATKFTFDKVFLPTSTQEDVFLEINDLVLSSLHGYNVTIFAYGQTGSGKTYTMEGSMSSGNYGIINRSIDSIFSNVSLLEEEGWTARN